MNALREAALEYAAKGWPVFPCWANKAPCLGPGGFHLATTDPDQINEWWDTWPRANIGFEPGVAELIVVDTDPGHSPEELEHEIPGIFETTFRSRTPRGGQHLFYSLDHGEVIGSRQSSIVEHVDIRSTGGYILLPPSKTADGDYVWEERGPIPFRPDELAEKAGRAPIKSSDWDTWIIEPDIPENVELAEQWASGQKVGNLPGATPALEGHGGDGKTLATAAMMKSFGLSEASAFEVLWAHFNPRCQPPWEADDLEVKIRNAYRYNTSPPGNMTPAYKVAKDLEIFAPVTSKTSNGGLVTQAGRFRFANSAAIEDIEPPSWLIDDLLTRKGYAIMFGSQSALKTFVAMDIALSIAADFYNEDRAVWSLDEVQHHGPVLFAAGEGRPGLKNRKKAWEHVHHYGERVENFILADPVPAVAVDGDVDAFVRGALERSPGGYELVVIDTVGRAMQGVNENAQEHASRFTALVQKIQYELGAAVLALHHTGVSDKERARGSSVFSADPDTIVRLDRQSSSLVVSMTMTKQKDASEWDQKKFLKGIEVDFGMGKGKNPLAIVQPGEDEITVAKVQSTVKDDDAKVRVHIIRSETLRILEEDSSVSWTDTDLAKILMTLVDEDKNPLLDIKSRTITDVLRGLRNDDKKMSRHYQHRDAKWKFEKPRS